MTEQDDKNKRIIEINGVKMEVDMRYATRVDTFKVGSPVKILKKNYSDSYDTYLGVIVGFTEFQNLPTIDVLAVKNDYAADMQFFTINANTKDIEIAQYNKYETLISKADIVKKMDRGIEQKEEELRTLEAKKKLFLEHFGKAYADELTNVSLEA